MVIEKKPLSRVHGLFHDFVKDHFKRIIGWYGKYEAPIVKRIFVPITSEEDMSLVSKEYSQMHSVCFVAAHELLYKSE